MAFAQSRTPDKTWVQMANLGSDPQKYKQGYGGRETRKGESQYGLLIAKHAIHPDFTLLTSFLIPGTYLTFCLSLIQESSYMNNGQVLQNQKLLSSYL